MKKKATVSLRNRVLRVLDSGRRERDVLTIQHSGGVEINTTRILNSAKGRQKIRTLEKMAADAELESA